jgi:hypothetical protein
MAFVNLPHTSKANTDPNLFSEVVANDQAITAQVNGNLDSTNLAADSVGTSELTDGAVLPANVGTIPSARVWKDSNTSIADNVETTLTFNQERWDTQGLHSTVSNTERLTAPIAGLYVVSAHIHWGSGITGVRSVLLRLNGTTYVAEAAQPSSGEWNTPTQSISTVVSLAAAEYAEVRVIQANGTAVSVLAGTATAQNRHEFLMTWLGPQS